MNNISLNDSLYYNAALEASKQEAKRQELKANKTDAAGKTKTFNQLINESVQQVQTESEIPEIQGMTFEQAEQFLIDEVYSKGDLLKQSPVPENFAAYKKAVGSFLKFVEKECYALESEKGAVLKKRVNGRLKPKQNVYTIIKVVNEKLANLASDILYNQRDQLRMTAKVNEISGLLIDVFY